MIRTLENGFARISFAAFLLFFGLPAGLSSFGNPGPVAVVLGTAQDGGLPQVNCGCDRCSAARTDLRLRRRAASLALLDSPSGKTFLIDATPDLPEQLRALLSDPAFPLSTGRTPIDGVLLTHAHVGHYAGLIYFGSEVLGSREMPVYATERMRRFLEGNAPWSYLLKQSHVRLVPLEPEKRVDLTASIRVTPILVPHRDEFSDTLAFIVEGPAKKLLWLPDIDRWDPWGNRLEELLEQTDYAFLDATFYSPAELPDRDISKIPHPLVTDTVARVRAMGDRLRARVFLVHLNHSNWLLGPDPGPASDIRKAGIEIAHEGQRLEL